MRQMACCIPDVDIQVIYGRTGRPGILSLDRLIKDIICIMDSNVSGSTVPIRPGRNIMFTSEPVTNFLVVNTVEDPTFKVSVTSPSFIFTPSTTPPTTVRGSTYYDGTVGGNTSSRFVGNNGSKVILDFNPKDILAGRGITVTRTETTATISLTNSGGPDVTTTTILPGVPNLTGTFKQETYRVLVTATAGTTVVADGTTPVFSITDIAYTFTAVPYPSAETADGIAIPLYTVNVAASSPTFGTSTSTGNVVITGAVNPLGLSLTTGGATLAAQLTGLTVTVAFPTIALQYSTGYATQITPFIPATREGVENMRYAHPDTSLLISGGDLTKVVVSIDSVNQLGLPSVPGLLPVGVTSLLPALITGLIPDTVTLTVDNVQTALNDAFSYYFGLEITVSGA